MPVVEPEFTFLQRQCKRLSEEAVELRQPTFGKAPERLNVIDMAGASDEFVAAVVDPEVPRNTRVYPGLSSGSISKII